MGLPKTLDVPLQALSRAKTVEDLKKVLELYFQEARRMHEQVFETLQMKEDKA